jgi:hypothetical protein
VCPHLSEYQCKKCKKAVAYLMHGIRTGVKRRFHGETKILHIWPNFQTQDAIYCVGCAGTEYPNIEGITGYTFMDLWKGRRDYDHVCEHIETNDKFVPGKTPDTETKPW